MPQTFTLGPTTAAQDVILAAAAARRGVTVTAMVNAEMARIFQRAKNEFDIDQGAVVAAAFNAASGATQASVKTTLGVP